MNAVVVTGAASGIGLLTCEHLARDGYSVIGVDRDEQRLRDQALAVGFRPVVGDIGAWETHERAADAAQEAGRLTGWVNNAGINWEGAAHEVDARHIEDGLRVLLTGPMFGASVAARRMLASGGGAIVNVASIQAVAAFPRMFVYDAAKAGVAMLAKQMAVDYGAAGIRSNAVLPGCVETPMVDETLPADLSRDEGLAREARQSPMLRNAQPAEIAEVIAFLLSDRASYINGALIPIDGGSLARSYAFDPITTALGALRDG